MNLVLLIMGIGMIIFPAYTSSDHEASKTSASNQDPAPAPSIALENIVPALSLPTPTAVPAATAAPTPVPLPTAVPTLPPSENPLLAGVPDDIRELVNNYFEARLSSIEDYKELIYNQEYVDEELTYKRVEYIVGFHNIQCYFKKGTGIVDYVIYVLNDVEIATIDTYAPSIDQLFIKYDEKGVPKIYLPGGGLSAEEEAYYNELSTAEDVAALVDDVNNRLITAVQEDSELQEFLMKITEITGDHPEEQIQE